MQSMRRRCRRTKKIGVVSHQNMKKESFRLKKETEDWYLETKKAERGLEMVREALEKGQKKEDIGQTVYQNSCWKGWL